MAYCGKCLHLDVCKTADSCDGHVPRCKHFMDKTIISQMPGEPRTRRDQLRAMSDEELAKFLLDADQGNLTVDVCDEKYCTPDRCPGDCTSAINKGLKAPAEETVP